MDRELIAIYFYALIDVACSLVFDDMRQTLHTSEKPEKGRRQSTSSSFNLDQIGLATAIGNTTTAMGIRHTS